MADEENWDVYRSGVPFDFNFNLTQHDDGNVFQGNSRSVIEYGNTPNLGISSTSRSTNLHVLHLQNEAEVARYRQMISASTSSNFRPIFNMRPSPGSGLLEGTSLLVGRNVGVPLISWMRNSSRILWEYDSNGSYKRFGVDWRKLGYMLGSALYKEHENGHFVGDLLNSTFVNEQEEKVVFVKDPARHSTLTPITGIQDDLSKLHALILWVEAEYPPNDIAANLKDLAIYKNLYPSVLPNTLDGLQQLSYFLCHNFLYFECAQRFAFCDGYRIIKQTHKYSFVQGMKFVGLNSIASNWSSILYTGGILDTVYQVEPAAHGGPEGLIHFFRSCKHHYNQTAAQMGDREISDQELDEELGSLFPNAIPKAFNALFQCTQISNADKIKVMKSHLNYAKRKN